jgi:23S rRNA-/tRNA-specific pseudouridylate synthase
MLLSDQPALLQHLQRHWHSHVDKRYQAWVSPPPDWQQTEIETPISKERDRKGCYTIHEQGRACYTHARVLCRNGQKALLELTPRTGRTHQLRVHLQSLGCPILGDSRYGGQPHPRLMLHACDLTIRTPALPEDMHWHIEPRKTPEGDWK